MELAEKVGEVVSARIGGELVGVESFVEEVGEAACRADSVDALQRVVASAIGRAGLATLAGRKRVPVQSRSSDDGVPLPTVGAKCRVREFRTRGCPDSRTIIIGRTPRL